MRGHSSSVYGLILILVLCHVPIVLGQPQILEQEYDATIAVVLPISYTYIPQQCWCSDYSIFNSAITQGIFQAEESFNLNVTVIDHIPDFPTLEQEIWLLAESGEFDLIIIISYEGEWGLKEAATNFTNQKFAIIDDIGNPLSLDNVASVTYKVGEMSFLAGSIAAMVSKSKNLGFISSQGVPINNWYLSGFEQGAHYIDPSISISAMNINFQGIYYNPYFNLPGGYNIANSMFMEDNIDIIYTGNLFNSTQGVINAAEDIRNNGSDVFMIGSDILWDDHAPGSVLLSTIKNFDVVVYDQIRWIVEGIWTNGTFYYGLGAGGMKISSMEHTRDEADAICDDGRTRWEHLDEINQLIISGNINVNQETDLEEILNPDNWNTDPHLCSEPDLVISDDSQSQSSSSSSLWITDNSNTSSSVRETLFKTLNLFPYETELVQVILLGMVFMIIAIGVTRRNKGG